jgi:chromosome segregation protein
VCRMRRAAVALVRQTRTVEAARERLAESEAELAPIDVFGDIDEATREILQDYSRRGQLLAEALGRARTRRAELLERMRRHQAAFATVRHLDSEGVDALRSLERALEGRRDPLPWRLAAGLFGGITGWFALPWTLELLGVTAPEWGAFLGAAVMSLAAAVVVPVDNRYERARATLAALGLEGDDERMRQLLRQREAYDAQREQVNEDAQSYDEARAEAERVEAAGLAFRDAVAPFLDALPPDSDPGEAFARWSVLAPRVAKEREALTAQVGYVADVPVAEVMVAPAAAGGEAVAELARLAAFHGVIDASIEEAPEAVTIAELASWLERVSEASWELWQEGADAYDRSAAQRLEGERATAAARTVWGERLVDAEAALEEALRRRDEVAREEAEAATALAWLWPRLASAAAPLPPSPAATPRRDPGGGLIGEEELTFLAADDAGASWDIASLRHGWGERRRVEEELAARRRELRAHLAASGAERIDDLATAVDAARAAAAAALAAWQGVQLRHPDLPPAELGSGDDLEEAFRRNEERATAAAAAERSAHEAALEAQRALARAQGADVVNLAVTAEAVEAAVAGAERVRGEVDVLALAYGELSQAIEAFRSEHRSRLEERASRYLVRFSGVTGRRVELGEAFTAAVREPSGDLAQPVQLSQGARDQLALALRLAVADLLSGDVALPLLFDDPFLHWDDGRLEQARATLRELSADRQVLVLSHRSDVATWGDPVVLERPDRPRDL